MRNVINDIIWERMRQKNEEGWSLEHDDEHELGELSAAASCYAQKAHDNHEDPEISIPPEGWPWDREWWKPKDARRDLIRAAALIVAEIERLDRNESHRD